MTNKQIISRLYPIIKPYRSKLILAMVGMIIVGALNAAQAWIVKDVIDEIFINKDETLLKILPIALIILFTVMKPFDLVTHKMLYIVALATMFIGNLFALRQQNMKRFLAFSSIAQAGFILLGILSNDQLGVSTVVYFVGIYVFTNLAAFGVVQSISLQTGKENMDDYNGLYRTNPKLSLIMMLALFSLAGIPPVAGFFGKFFLFTAAASQGLYLLVFLAVVNVTISLYYYLLVIRAMFLRKSEDAIPYFENKIYMKLGLLLAVIGVLFIGLYSPIYDYIFEISKF